MAADTMTNWHDPILEAAEGRSSSSLSDKPSRLSLPGSHSHQACSRCGWRVHVSRLLHPSYIDPFSHHTSWEFVLNLDYEYSIITGKRELKWSAPVRALSALMVSEAFIRQVISFTWGVVGSRYWP